MINIYKHIVARKRGEPIIEPFANFGAICPFYSSRVLQDCTYYSPKKDKVGYIDYDYCEFNNLMECKNKKMRKDIYDKILLKVATCPCQAQISDECANCNTCTFNEKIQAELEREEI